MVKAFTNSKTEINIRGSGRMANDRVKVSLHGKVDRFLMVYFLKILCMEMVCLYIRKEAGEKSKRLLCKKES